MNPYFSFCRTLAVSIAAASIITAVMAQTPSSSKLASADIKVKPPAPSDGKPYDRPEEALTASQLAKIKSILAPYNPASLNVNDAKAIKRALRDAELRPIRALGEALLAAGFDPRRMDALDPPPPRPPRDGNESGAALKQPASNAPK